MVMNDDSSWRRAFEVFDQVVSCPPDERAAAIREACGDDAELRANVESLVGAADDDSEFLEDAARENLAQLLNDDLSGREVGGYRILRRIGVGGMGAVYLAERTGVGGTVALKLVRGELADPSRRARFLQEQRALARLAHPNIARLLDAGVSEEGTAYIAMEYVEGRDIVSHCDAERSDLKSRLMFVEQMGRAVQHAHENFVVHRDLKPSNVLVDREGVVKLLDFGIAKLVDETDAGDRALTRTGYHLATPAYAAPEQLVGGTISAASDVFSLGVLTYELLTGRRPDTGAPVRVSPLGKSGADQSAGDQSVGDQSGAGKSITAKPDTRKPVRKPSTVVTIDDESPPTGEQIAQARGMSPDRLARALKGDLDTICLKALQPEMARRYSSAESFVDDIRRFLEGRPVAARPDSVGYRVKKFVRRNRIPVVASLAGLVVLAAFLATSIRHNRELERERDRARAEALVAEQTSAFMFSLFDTADPRNAVDPDKPLREVLANAEHSIDGTLADDADLSTRLYALLARLNHNMGERDRALALLDTARTRYINGTGVTPAAAIEYHTIAAQNLVDRNVFDSARVHYAKMLSLAEESDSELLVARTLSALAALESHEGSYERADSLYAVAIDVYDRSRGASHWSNAAVKLKHAGVLWRLDRLSEADSLAADAVDALRRRFGDYHARLFSGVGTRAQIAMKASDIALADSMLRWRLRIWELMPSADPVDRASVLSEYGSFLNENRQFAAARDTLRSALEVSIAVRGEAHRRNSAILNNLAISHGELGELDAAVDALERALRINRRLLAADHPSITINLYNQATLLSRAGRHMEAARQFRDVVSRDSSRFGDDHTEVAIDRVKLAGELISLGRLTSARRVLARARRVLAEQFEPPHRRIAEGDETLGRLLIAEGNCGDAAPVLSSAGEAFTSLFGADSDATLRVEKLREQCE